jgi:hypothetical protein
MLLALISLACADDLVLTAFELDASNGVTLEYALSPSTWQACDDALRRSGVAPALVVAWEAGGYKKTVHVELKDQVATRNLSGGTWPTGMTADVRLKSDWGGFDRVRLNGRSATSHRVTMRGGTPGGSPIQQPQPVNRSSSSSSSRVSVQPRPRPGPAPSGGGGGPTPEQIQAQAQAAAQIAQIAAEAERRRRELEEQRRREEEDRQRRLEEQRRREAEWRAYVAEVSSDPSHPTTTMCREQYPQLNGCIASHLADPIGFELDRECEAFEKQGWVEECTTWGEKKRWPATVAACKQVFGTQVEGIRCLNYASEATHEASDDVFACRGFSDDREVLSCIKRLGQTHVDATELVKVCEAEYDDHMGCLNYGARGGSARPQLAKACRVGTKKEGKAIQCMYEFRGFEGPDPGPAVEACNSLFPDDPKGRLKCYERARIDPDADRIAACADQEGRDRLKCVGR